MVARPPLPEFSVRPLTDDDRRAIATWSYPGALKIYDPGAGAAELRAPDHVALSTPGGELLGYGTFGVEARVPGGRYDDADDDEVVDVGIGLRPDLVGTGAGAGALLALLRAPRLQSAARVRATVATVNGRATAFVLGQGFSATHVFVRERDGRSFTQYEQSLAPPRS
ncbi:MAG: hypothetical protein AAF799_44170 [Myxococcota bacterium]